MNKIKVFFILLCASFFTQAQTVDEVIENYIKAIGGRDKIKAIQSAKTDIKMKAQMFEFPTTAYIKKDGSMRTETEIQGLKIIQAYNSTDSVGWSVNPMQGDNKAHKMNDEQRKEMSQENDKLESPLIDYKKKGHTAELLGKEDLEGDEVFKIMLTKKNGNITYYYIDTQSFLIWKEESKIKFKDREYQNETYFSNYTTQDGITSARTIENYSDGKVTMQMNIEKMEYNGKFEDSLFKMPEEKKQ
ncbi:MAG TPA: hypothetical protein VNZ49_04830 [Bacteroidia bacterium]|jgi:hypothetical protein|nr:hypothetical protein [Bacteroidia bacterium]